MLPHALQPWVSIQSAGQTTRKAHISCSAPSRCPTHPPWLLADAGQAPSCRAGQRWQRGCSGAEPALLSSTAPQLRDSSEPAPGSVVGLCHAGFFCTATRFDPEYAHVCHCQPLDCSVLVSVNYFSFICWNFGGHRFHRVTACIFFQDCQHVTFF